MEVVVGLMMGVGVVVGLDVGRVVVVVVVGLVVGLVDLVAAVVAAASAFASVAASIAFVAGSSLGLDFVLAVIVVAEGVIVAVGTSPHVDSQSDAVAPSISSPSFSARYKRYNFALPMSES